jgi:hypothetical protein
MSSVELVMKIDKGDETHMAVFCHLKMLPEMQVVESCYTQYFISALLVVKLPAKLWSLMLPPSYLMSIFGQGETNERKDG